MVRCSEVGGSALTICTWSGSRASSVFIKGSAHLSFHIVHSSSRYLLNRNDNVSIQQLVHKCSYQH